MTPLQRFERAIDWLTPDHMKGDMNLRKRARMFLFSHTFGPFLGLPVPLAMYLIDPAPFPHVPILAASILAFWPFLALIKLFPRRYTALALLSVTNLNFAVLWGAFHYGGASSPFLMWYMLMPMLAFFYLGSSKAMRISVFAEIVVGLGTYTTAYLISGKNFPAHIPLEHMVYAGLVSALCSTTYAFFMASYYSSVVDSQSELLKEISRHEETLDELTRAKEDTDRANDALEHAKNLAEARNAELESAKASLEYNALHDALTGLPNRRYLDKILAQHANRCARTGEGVALLHIDLDRFKQINDTLGHFVGDEVLVHVAGLLRYTVRKHDFVARVGGDEFIVVCIVEADDDDGELAETADRIIERIREPVPYEGHLCRLGASVGIALETGDKVSPKSLMVNSDIALYRAKNDKRGRYEFFSEELQAEIVNSKRIADDILRGIEQKEFIAFYQPQFDARSYDIVGVEALVRWKHPIKGILAPAAFLRVAEELGAVATLDQMVLEQAVADFADWQDTGFGIPKVSVNVSARRLNHSELADRLRDLDIRPGALAFELVESIFLDETDETVAQNIRKIRELGVDIEIDDFGTGHASIVSLLNLDPVRLKIDRQFVTPISSSPEKSRVVSSIIEMGKSLGIGVVAEGVETLEQAQILADLGCDVLQGYAFAKPMSAADLQSFVKKQKWRKAVAAGHAAA
jgi:diguanylate cyclase (GGDEF)-like protein